MYKSPTPHLCSLSIVYIRSLVPFLGYQSSDFEILHYMELGLQVLQFHSLAYVVPVSGLRLYLAWAWEARWQCQSSLLLGFVVQDLSYCVSGDLDKVCHSEVQVTRYVRLDCRLDNCSRWDLLGLSYCLGLVNYVRSCQWNLETCLVLDLGQENCAHILDPLVREMLDHIRYPLGLGMIDHTPME